MTATRSVVRTAPPVASAEETGRSYPLGATVVDGGVNFSLFSRTAAGVELVVLRPGGRRHPVSRDPDRSGDQPDLPLLARVRAAGAAGADLRLPGRGAVGPRSRAAVRPHQGPARPVRPGRGRPGGLRPRGREAGGRQRGDGNEERGRRSRRVRLGGRPPARPALCAHHHLRDARPRLHPGPEFRGRREDARHLRRADREDPLSAGSRHHGGRIAAGVRVRPPGVPAGRGQLLGLPAGLLLRAAPGVQLAARRRSARWTSSATW